MRCFFSSSSSFSVFCLFLNIHVRACVCMSIYKSISISLCNFLFSALKDMTVEILIDLFLLLPFVSRLSIFIRQVAPIGARSANIEDAVRASRISLDMNMNICLEQERATGRKCKNFSDARCDIRLWKTISLASFSCNRSFVDNLSLRISLVNNRLGPFLFSSPSPNNRLVW